METAMPDKSLRASTRSSLVLVVDDEPSNVILISNILHRHGFDKVKGITHADLVVAEILETNPDTVLLDVHMPGIDGLTLLRQIRSATADQPFLPVIVLTADTSAQLRLDALEAGATDFITKPFDGTEVALRVRNCVEQRDLHLQVRAHSAVLEARVRERTAELQRSHNEIEQAHDDTLKMLHLISEYRDDDTHGHTLRVGHSSALLAMEAGMDKSYVDVMRQAAPLHDIGKVGIADIILLKPGSLTKEEFTAIKDHPTMGASVLAQGRSDILKMAHTVALTHHERWDGTGYPRCIQQNQIPFEGRLVGITDVFDALTHARPYKPAWSVDRAVEEMVNGRATHFDPALLDLFLENIVDKLSDETTPLNLV
ncbi:MAG: HD domain-containing phosphohydrolase [Acidimicrobiales bacterium]